MKIVIDFYRTRDVEDAHAVVARETAEAADLDDAIEIARQLSRTSTCRSNRTRWRSPTQRD
ncbi:hypothetical protein [Mesorhizobium tamadayense]|uniref:hypothetical protein n=1 Tax=Mesorhizobium tamadayense TaxID=425306 RepID=UPI00315DD337